ncbi:MAG TPA: hypothetical protein ENO25_04745 [Desulfobacteraceae bacterium]|nr:hypothetical protein [Desulfobacteraceae bacterium]
MKLILGIFFVLLAGCGNAADAPADIECEITFDILDACQYQGTKISLVTEGLAVDEKKLVKLKVDRNGRRHVLSITPDTSILAGDKGYILFEDVNFDGTPDLAVSTSFGLVNQYLDYWVYDKANDKYVYLGNHARFSLNAKDKTLSNEVKINAATYDRNTYSWDSGVLKRVDK